MNRRQPLCSAVFPLICNTIQFVMAQNLAGYQILRFMLYHCFMLLLTLALLTQATVAQKKVTPTPTSAEKAYKLKDYYTAVAHYKAVFALKKHNLSGSKLVTHYFYYAESARQSYNQTRAEKYYKKVLESSYKDKHPEAAYYYPYCLKHNGKYQAAIDGFNAFISSSQKSSSLQTLQQRAKHEIEGCKLALELIPKPDASTKIIQLGSKVNTKYADFSPHLVGETLYYTSLRFEPKVIRGRILEREKALVGKIMVASNRGENSYQQSKNKNLNAAYKNSGNTNLNTDGSKLYFTKCEFDERHQKMICQIYYCLQDAKGDWGVAVKLPENINVDGVTCTHPAIGYDSTRQKEVLYFSSERKGGKGKKDIWAAVIEGDGSYGDPFNLGEEVNTRGDEVSPFYHNTTQSLYFSSDYRPGFGGYDIFHLDLKAKESKAVNVGIPLNSAANDLYFIINADDSTGYFASNRPGSQILTGESCCNDIYALKLPVFPSAGAKKPAPPVVVETPVETPEVDSPITQVTVVETPEPEPFILPELQPAPEPELPAATQVTLDRLNALLPLALYFHNNEPRNSSMTYTETYKAYINLEETYIKEHVPQYNASLQDQITENINDFFAEEVNGNYNKMHEFFDALIDALENDYELEVAIQGYTSPRASAAYNKALSGRRIASVTNDMLAYKNGVLRTFLDKGQLTLKELPLGEGSTPLGISDDIDDPRNSIYSVEAASQRRVNFIVVALQEEE